MKEAREPQPPRRGRTGLIVGFSIVILLFLITRLPFFLDAPFWGVFPDSAGYYIPVDQISKGFFPTFTARTPGYPLFLGLVFLFLDSNLGAIAVQNALSLLSALLFVFVIYRVYAGRFPWMPAAAGAALGVFIASTVHLSADTSLLTESLYVSCIVVFFAFLLEALHGRRHWPWIMAGCAFTAALLVRPSALFLVPVIFLVLFFLLVNRRGLRPVLAFVLPPCITLLALASYNHFTIGAFSASTFGEHALVSFTNTLMTPHPSYPEPMNAAITRCLNRIRPLHRQVIETSRDPERINRILQKYYNLNRRLMFNTLSRREDPQAADLYMKWRPMLRRAGWDAIRSRPAIYLKFVASNLQVYLFHRKTDHDFYAALQRRRALAHRYRQRFSGRSAEEIFRALRIYYKQDYLDTLSIGFSRAFLKEYWDLDPLDKDGIHHLLKQPLQLGFLHRVHRFVEHWHNTLFRSNLWIYLYFAVLLVTLSRWILSRFRHLGAFVLAVLTVSALLHGVLVSMSALPTDRLNYPLDYVIYLAPLLLPLALRADPRERDASGKDDLSERAEISSP